METQAPLRIDSWEALYALPGFVDRIDPQSVSIGSFVAPYAIRSKELRRCSITSCGTPHKTGLVVRLQDGSLTGIGRRCGAKYFPNAWQSLLNQYSAAVASSQAAELILTLEKSAKELAQDLERIAPEVAWYKRAKRSIDSLPPPVLKAIDTMTKDKNPAITIMRPIRSDAEFNQRRMFDDSLKRFDYVPEIIGELRTARFLDPGRDAAQIVDYELRPLVAKALGGDLAVERKRAAIAKSIAAARRRIEIAEQSIAELRAFTSPRNVALIPYVRAARNIGVTSASVLDGVISLVFRAHRLQR